jgi:hypothetical protein
MYRNLNAEKIIRTVETMHKRIEERFPVSGMKRFAANCIALLSNLNSVPAGIAKPLKSLRLLVALSITIMIVGLAVIVRGSSLPLTGFDLIGLVQVLEAGLNVVILTGRRNSLFGNDGTPR